MVTPDKTADFRNLRRNRGHCGAKRQVKGEIQGECGLLAASDLDVTQFIGSSTDVPRVTRLGRGPAIKKGWRMRSPVFTTDVAPTVFETLRRMSLMSQDISLGADSSEALFGVLPKFDGSPVQEIFK